MIGAGFTGIAAGRRRLAPRPPAAFAVTLTGLTNGSAEHLSTVGFTISEGTAQSQRWQMALPGQPWADIAGATTPTLAIDLLAGLLSDGAMLRAGVTSGGTEVFSSPVAMVFAAPQVVQPLPDLTLTTDTGVAVQDASAAFAGVGVTYTIDPLAGVTIDAQSGAISIATDIVAPQSGTVLNVYATNSGGAASTGQTLTVNDASAFAVTVESGEPVITLTAGTFSIAIATGVYAGTYSTDIDGATLSTATVSTAPAALVRPALAGGTAQGDTLSVTPGLWLYAEPSPPTPTYQWQRNGVDIPGATGSTYVLILADAGASIAVVETFGGIAAGSLPITADAGASFVPSDLVALADDFDASKSNINLVDGRVQSIENEVAGATNRLIAVNGVNRPETGLVTQNGLNAASFSDPQYLLHSTTPTFYPSGSLVVAFRPNATNNAADSIFSIFGGTNTFQIDTSSIANGDYVPRVNSNAHTNLSAGMNYAGSWIVLGYRWNASTGETSLWINGAVIDSAMDYAGTYSASPSRIILASNRSINQQLDCDVGQLWLFSAAISDTDMANMHSYAQTKWGI